MVKMGLQFGLEKGQFCKRPFRALFYVEGIASDGTNALPPKQSSRPNLAFKEMIAKHISEDVYYPAKPDWRTIQLVLYDLKTNGNPVFDWIREVYNPQSGSFREPNAENFIKEARVELYDGCGNRIESWNYEDVWPQSVNFQVLDMQNSEILTVDITLRYVRAYVN
jgi:hypothetical protein